MYLELAGLYAYSYFIGAVPTPYLIARLVKGIDLRQYGSGNVGGSNVIRQLGKKWFLPLTALEFALKGLSPALVGLVLLDDVAGLHRASPWFLLAPLLALVGNNWSVFLRFQGGRGLLVICGMLVTLTPLLFLGAILVYLLGWRLTRNSAIWALVAVAILPVLALVPPRYLAAGWERHYWRPVRRPIPSSNGRRCLHVGVFLFGNPGRCSFEAAAVQLPGFSARFAQEAGSRQSLSARPGRGRPLGVAEPRAGTISKRLGEKEVGTGTFRAGRTK